MIRKFIGIILLTMVLCPKVQSQEFLYKAENLPSNLTKDAKAIVRKDETVFKVISKSRALKQVKFAITILNKNGDDYAKFTLFYDKLRTINNLKIRLYDKFGELIKKVKNADIKDYSAASGYSLYEDNRVKYYEPYINSYPYTLEYEYEVEHQGLLHYPVWQPVTDYEQAVQNSSFEIIMPPDLKLRYKESNLENEPELREDNGRMHYTWSVANVSAMEKEPYSPFLYEFTPIVYTAPSGFKIEGFEGEMTSWAALGKWQNKLNEDLDELTPETHSMLRKLTAEDQTDMDKAKRIYSYLQEKVRYVNITEGLGGWQPFPASTVQELGYGDCKALSNYMVAMLKSVGVKSYYTLVKAGNDRNMNADFPSRQSNHIIVCVPFENDTVWLECTNQRIPFGYLGNFTDDRDVLLITEKGGQIAHTKIYHQKENIQLRTAQVRLDETGNGSAEIFTTYAGLQYDNISSLFTKERADQKLWLDKSIAISNFKLENFNLTQEKERVPSATLYLELSLTKYASVSGKRMFVPLNLLNKINSVPEEIEQRKTNIDLSFAFHDTDTIIYQIPKNFKIEYKPEDVSMVTEFGEYETKLMVKDRAVIFIRTRKMNKGVFSPESYPDFVKFYKQMVKADKAKLVLVKVLD